eukprot:4437462-Pleurochrysis_carterae.AAC.5
MRKHPAAMLRRVASLPRLCAERASTSFAHTRQRRHAPFLRIIFVNPRRMSDCSSWKRRSVSVGFTTVHSNL